jgi:hypothetical protein
MKKLFTFLFIATFFSVTSYGFERSVPVNKRTIALLDLTIPNAETNDAELYSAQYCLKVAGLPFITTTAVNTAIQYKVIVASSKFETFTFSTAEKDSLKAFVNRGGILVAPNIKDPYLFPVFGISASALTSSYYKLSFNMFLGDPSFRWLNDTMEQTISLGRNTYSTVINTRKYTVSGALTLAKFDDGSTAITKYIYGSGKAYALGFSFKNLIVTNQMNHDYDAQRIYSNGFEPTSDAIMLFLKGICIDQIPYSTWLHTSPYNSRSTLMITHDIDATSSYDTMSYYANYEASIGLSATYLMTTHYISDGALSAFYNSGSIPLVQYLLTKGHKIGSHSVGHFTDFDDENVVPLGVLGNTASNYLPYNAGPGNSTTGATVLGEAEVSKNLLEANLGVKVRTFRAGYLCFNDKLANGLDTTGYVYNTTFSACDVLTNFPFLNHRDRSTSTTLTKVWEIPMTISDVFTSNTITPTNYHAKDTIWQQVVKRNGENYAPCVLLVHPTRYYKLFAEQELINGLPPGTMVTDLETYADYWRSRDSINFSTILNNAGDSLTVIVPSMYLPLNQKISFVVDNGQSLTSIKARDEFGNPISFIRSNWDSNGTLLHFGSYPLLGIQYYEAPENKGLIAEVYPNPFENSATLEIWFKEDAKLNITIYNIMGEVVKTVSTPKMEAGIFKYDISASELPSGTYFCNISTGSKSMTKKMIIIK